MTIKDDNLNKYSAARRAFETGTIWNASEDEMREYIKGIATTRNSNDSIKNADIAKMLTINHLQTRKLIKDLNEQNNRTQLIALVVTFVAVVVAIIGLF